jgi:ribosomal protein S18 acetylase RimI-like enzyme
MVLQGPGERYKQGSHWVVGDQHGFAELHLMRDSKSYFKNTLYIEHLAIKESCRGRGHGRALYNKIEVFARNIDVDYIQLDSEQEAVGFWYKIGFKKLDVIYYKNKTAMIIDV